MLEKRSICTIGAGTMGGALIAGLVRAGRVSAAQITAMDVREEALEALGNLGVKTSTDLGGTVAGRDLVILGVKPQDGRRLLAQLDEYITPSTVLVSIMAGVETRVIETLLSAPVPVVRVMPQISARIGAAAVGVCAGLHASAQHVRLVSALFDEVGSSVVVDEVQMNAVTGLCGSGPAYVYTVIEAMAAGGVLMGLSTKGARCLAAQTVLGAARMVLETNMHPAELRDEVTSPGGTTIAGLQALEDGGVRAALMGAVEVASLRAGELGRS